MVTVLAWCVGDDLDVERARAMREGYEQVRPLEERERRGLAAEGAFAALQVRRDAHHRLRDARRRRRAAAGARLAPLHDALR